MRTEAILLIRCNCFEMWWPGTELNRRRQPFQGCALPPELPGHFVDSSGKQALAASGSRSAVGCAGASAGADHQNALRAWRTTPIIATGWKSLNAEPRNQPSIVAANEGRRRAAHANSPTPTNRSTGRPCPRVAPARTKAAASAALSSQRNSSFVPATASTCAPHWQPYASRRSPVLHRASQCHR
jgi:hypothetical protein